MTKKDKSDKIKISVVVCAKNEEKRIVKSLRSIIKNKVDEIIVVDGNSVDKTVYLSKKFTKKVIISKKGTLVADRQVGINAAKNSFIAMIDADHILKKNDIINLYKDLKKYNFDIVQSQLKAHSKSSFLNLAEEEAWDVTHNIPGARLMIGTAPCIYKKEIFRFVKFENKIVKNMDDTDFMYRLSKLNKFKVGIGDTKIIQFHHSSLKEFLRKFLWYGRGDAEFVKKYPHKILSILFHQIIRYPLIYPLKAILKLKLRSVIYFISMGLIRFWGLSTFVFRK